MNRHAPAAMPLPAGRTTDAAKHQNGFAIHPPPRKQTDAGMRHLDHCKLHSLREMVRSMRTDRCADAARLPQWRYRLRQWLIPIVRAETPYLALLQSKLRTPMLDSYFALTANLGTHTFFMVMLPILFWCGYATFARAYVFSPHISVLLSDCLIDRRTEWCISLPAV
jgi:hypothetical protein